ncbi:MAG: cyclase family protein [Acidobacteriota bacterium]
MIDISVPLDAGLPLWPGSPGYRISSLAALGCDSDANVSLLAMDLHTGTHIDAPRHFLADGATVEEIALETLVGRAWVAEVPTQGDIGPTELDALSLPPGIERLLLRTPNSALWSEHPGEFRKDFAALSLAGAHWIVERGIRLFGIDYLSVQRFADGPETHRVLLRAGVVLLESVNLSAVKPGPYDLTCLPLSLIGTEAAPARAILRPLDP